MQKFGRFFSLGPVFLYKKFFVSGGGFLLFNGAVHRCRGGTI